MSWKFDRKTKTHRMPVLDLPFEMVVYEQQKNTVVITCKSHNDDGPGNLTYANSILAGKIQAEEMIQNGRWVEFAPEYKKQPVQEMPKRIIAHRVEQSKLEQLVNRFKG
jgi:hypothetical protein